MNSTITFDKLLLEGFGPYEEAVEFNFSDGINVYTANNETGKSTMAAGIAAVIYGLTHSQKSSNNFSLERFRNWNRPRRCYGELTFTSKVTQYKIERDFDTHDVSLWEFSQKTGQRSLVISGNHNPNARKRLDQYDDQIKELFGIATQELFFDTFFVVQPLPESDKISQDLQEMISGNTGVSFQEAVLFLEESVKRLTKFTGQKGLNVSARNMVKDGKIEQMDEEISALKKKLRESTSTADSLQDLQNQVTKLNSALLVKKQELKQKQNTLLAWNEWKLLRDRYDDEYMDRDNFERDRIAIDNLNKQIQEEQDVINRKYAAFLNAPKEIENDLVHLAQIGKSLAELQEKVKQAEKNYSALLAEDESIKIKLQDYENLSALGQDPPSTLRNLKRIAQTTTEAWSQYLNRLSQKSDIEQLLEQKYAVFQNASEHELEYAKNVDLKKMALDTEYNRAELEYNQLRQTQNNFELERVSFEQRFVDVASAANLDPDDFMLKSALIKNKRDFERQLDIDIKKPAKSPVMLALGVGLVLAVIAYFAMASFENSIRFPGTGAAFLLGVVLIFAIGSRRNQNADNQSSAMKEQLQNIISQMAALDQKLGQYAKLDESALIQMSVRLKNYLEEKERLNRLMPTNSESRLELLANNLRGVEKKRQEFTNSVQKYLSIFPNVSDALVQWREHKANLDRLNDDLHQYVFNQFGLSTLDIREILMRDASLAEPLQELSSFITAFGKVTTGYGAHSISVFMSQFDSLFNNWWDKQINLAQDYVILRDSRKNLVVRIESEKKTWDDYLQTFRDKEVDNEQLLNRYANILLKYDQDSEEALAKYREFKSINQRISNSKKTIELIITNHNCASEEEFLKRLKMQNDKTQIAFQKWENFIDSHPGLPSTNDSGDLEKTKKSMDNLEKSIKELENEVADLESQENNGIRMLARLEGGHVVNIAAEELVVKDLEQKKANLEFTAQALAIAHQELKEAVSDYKRSYHTRLQEQISEYCREIAPQKKRGVILDSNFNMTVSEDGRPVKLSQLSKGARDQIYLAVRFAIADLLAEEYTLPMILDDSFTTSDLERLQSMKQIIDSEARNRQFILLAHDPNYADWGSPVEIGKV